MKKSLVFMLLIVLGVHAAAQTTVSFADLRAMADAAPAEVIETHVNRTFAAPGTVRRSVEIKDDLFIEGYVLAEPDNPNKDLHFSIHYTTANSGSNAQCTYMTGLDGRYGLRLNFKSAGYLKPLRRYHYARLNLKGATLLKEGESYMVHGLTDAAITDVRFGDETTVPAPKLKRISDLTDEDIFTYVTLTDCEFMFKDGAYINVYEEYGRSGGPKFEGVYPNNLMHSWASVICDDSLTDIYLLMSTRVKWRRSGSGVPQGKGNLSGIVVKSFLPRYGLQGRYAIRPLAQQDVAFAFSGESSFKTIAEWNWGDNVRTFRTTAGVSEDIVAQGILPDVGEGELTTDLPHAKIYRCKDFNNTEVFKVRTPGVKGDRGAVNYGAIRIVTPGKNWWNWKDDCANSVIVTVSTKGLSGSMMYMAFTFCGGNQLASGSAFYPSYWCVEYSTDGQNFTSAGGREAVMRSLPWWNGYGNMKDVGYPTSSEAGMGYTEHIFPLPADLLGHEKVWLRISPSRKIVSTLAYRNQECGLLTPYLNGECIVNFGTVKVGYR